MKCQEETKHGTKYGSSGKCYTSEDQKAKARKQALAMIANGYKPKSH